MLEMEKNHIFGPAELFIHFSFLVYVFEFHNQNLYSLEYLLLLIYIIKCFFCIFN